MAWIPRWKRPKKPKLREVLKLKECPCCGGDAKLHRLSKRRVMMVQCEECGVQIIARYAERNKATGEYSELLHRSPMYAYTNQIDQMEVRDEIIRRWNYRHNERSEEDAENTTMPRVQQEIPDVPT